MAQFATFTWDDPFLLEDQLTEDEPQIRDMARDFAQSTPMPRSSRCAGTRASDLVLLRAFGKLGFLGANIKLYGCAGIGFVAFGLIARELERVDTCFRSAVGVQSGLVMAPIYMFGSEEQKQKHLPGKAMARSSAASA